MRSFAAVCLVLLVATPARAQVFAFASADRVNRKIAGHVDDYTHGLGHDRRIYSPILNQPRDLYVYLPPGYDPKKAYPLLFYFHIARVDESEFVGSGRLIELDQMIQAGEFPPTIVVCPDGTITGRNHVFEPHSFYLNGVNGRFEDHVLNEVIPFVTCRYSVRPERQAHAIFGLSGGGLGALSIAMRHRDYFATVASMSSPVNLLYDNCDHDILEDFRPESYRWKPTYDPNEVIGRFFFGLRQVRARRYIEPVFGDDIPTVNAGITAINPANLLFQSGIQPGELAIYLHYAGRDGYNFDAQNQSFAWLAARSGISVTMASDPSANHNLRYFRQNHHAVFCWLGQHLLPPAGAP
ncbi:MAG: enterochelin esterase-like enzyme [Planctomycetota bacterium]|nr:enterochelin esterase-like enzyme [Planctomycetota bacterium]